MKVESVSGTLFDKLSVKSINHNRRNRNYKEVVVRRPRKIVADLIIS